VGHAFSSDAMHFSGEGEKLHESMDTKLNFSLAYHPQTDGQTERLIKS
jgi:hypothetical protein